MDIRRAWPVAVAAATVATFALVPANAAPPSQNPRPTQDVNVTNTADNPVPVSAAQSGDWTVGINGTVNVADQREPFQAKHATILTPSQGGRTEDVFTVPAEKRLVLEFVSVAGNADPAQDPDVELRGSNSNMGPFIPLQRDANEFRAAEQVLAFFEPGEAVQVLFGIGTPDPGVGPFMTIFVSGYLVPA